MFLSDEQESAVITEEPRVLVAASAGSGKTTVIAERIKFLLNKGIEPKKIFAITYTNMAAQEMQERVENPFVFIGTIHSLANKILLINGIDTSKIIEEKSFDELLKITADRNIDLPEIEHLLVDEFQDISDEEDLFIMDTLQAKNIFVVGDSCQAIYGFKGGNYRNFIRMVNSRHVMVYNLTNNYRNSKRILSYANQYLDNISDIYRVNSNTTRKEKGDIQTFDYNLQKIYLF
jgi:superfamily I DNA/RNA helicase